MVAAAVIALAVAAAPLLLPTGPPSAFRDGRDLECEDAALAAWASAKVARAGVDGLLALPLLVFRAGVGGRMGVAESRFGSRSSTGLTVTSFLVVLLPLGAGGSGGGGMMDSTSGFAGGSGLLGAAAGAPLGGFGSTTALAPFVCAGMSGVPELVPFGWLEAAEPGRSFAVSALVV